MRNERKISSGWSGFSGALVDSDNFGVSVAAVGDVDGDGVGDLAVGAYGDDDGGTNRGAVWLLGLDVMPSICGNGVLDPLEECDDGGNGNGDACTAVCEVEDEFWLYGLGHGGSVEMTVDQIPIVVVTTPGQPAAQVIAALAGAINADPTLAALGTTALADGNSLVTNGTINDVTITDPGFGPAGVPAARAVLRVALALLLLAATAVMLGRPTRRQTRS